MIKKQFPLSFQWPTQEPFLFCVHHLDYYPKGNSEMAVDSVNLKGRSLGEDFEEKNGFRMYHGKTVPGFPAHPHRGFETVTLARKGLIDHADSMGASARYGNGDVQWLTAGSGIQHSEMFPLISENNENTLELFQIWLNLPKNKKMVQPHFTMLWHEKIQRISLDSGQAELTLIAGKFNTETALPPPPDSWASEPENEVAIWLLTMKKGSVVDLPVTKILVNRTIYFFEGKSLLLNDKLINAKTGLELISTKICTLEATSSDIQILVLQAKPINEPIVQHGPFVMNTREEIMQTFNDYEKTQFGGWKWPRHDMVHSKKMNRFTKYPSGSSETPEAK